jgi:hypothetical protein
VELVGQDIVTKGISNYKITVKKIICKFLYSSVFEKGKAYPYMYVYSIHFDLICVYTCINISKCCMKNLWIILYYTVVGSLCILLE